MRMNVKRAAECNEQHFVKCLTPLSLCLSIFPTWLCLLNCVRILTPATADQQQQGTDCDWPGLGSWLIEGFHVLWHRHAKCCMFTLAIIPVCTPEQA